MVLESRILPVLVGAGTKGGCRGCHQPGHAACQACPWPGAHQLLLLWANATPTRVSSLSSKPSRLVRIREAKGRQNRQGTDGESQRYRCREGDTHLKLPSSLTGCEIISDAEASTCFGLVQRASSANIAALRAGETLFFLFPTPDTSSKISIGQKEQTNAFIVSKALIKSPR